MMKKPHYMKQRCPHETRGKFLGRLRNLSQTGFASTAVILIVSLSLSCSRVSATEQSKTTLTQPAIVLSTSTSATVIETASQPQLDKPTPKPSSTPTLASTATLELVASSTAPVKAGPAIAALVYAEVGNIVLVDSMGNSIWTISFDSNHAAWSRDGCQLYVTVTTGEEIRLLSIDLNGQVLQELFVGGPNAVGGWRTWPKLSPTREWITYVVWSGERYRAGAEFQDVEVIAVGENKEPLRLTTRGGAWMRGAVWSFDGTRLAYSDRDEFGVVQLYHSNPDGSDRRQLSQFTSPDIEIGAISWSPDGSTLAFTTYYGDGLGGLWVASSNGTRLREMIIDNASPVQEDWLWWNTDGEILVAKTRGYVPADGLHWIDTEAGQIRYTFYESEAPAKQIAHPFPIADIQIVGFLAGDNDYYQHSFSDGSTTLWAKQKNLLPNFSQWTLLQQASSAPYGSISIDRCLRK